MVLYNLNAEQRTMRLAPDLSVNKRDVVGACLTASVCILIDLLFSYVWAFCPGGWDRETIVLLIACNALMILVTYLTLRQVRRRTQCQVAIELTSAGLQYMHSVQSSTFYPWSELTGVSIPRNVFIFSGDREVSIVLPCDLRPPAGTWQAIYDFIGDEVQIIGEAKEALPKNYDAQNLKLVLLSGVLGVFIQILLLAGVPGTYLLPLLGVISIGFVGYCLWIVSRRRAG